MKTYLIQNNTQPMATYFGIQLSGGMEGLTHTGLQYFFLLFMVGARHAFDASYPQKEKWCTGTRCINPAQTNKPSSDQY